MLPIRYPDLHALTGFRISGRLPVRHEYWVSQDRDCEECRWLGKLNDWLDNV